MYLHSLALIQLLAQAAAVHILKSCYIIWIHILIMLAYSTARPLADSIVPAFHLYTIMLCIWFVQLHTMVQGSMFTLAEYQLMLLLSWVYNYSQSGSFGSSLVCLCAFHWHCQSGLQVWAMWLLGFHGWKRMQPYCLGSYLVQVHQVCLDGAIWHDPLLICSIGQQSIRTHDAQCHW